MKITNGVIKSLNPCEEGYKYWLKKKEYDLAKFMTLAHEEGHSDWAHWLFIRSVSKERRTKYAIFSAELVLHIFEDKYPNDDRPRRAIQSARTANATNVVRDAVYAATDAAAYAAAYAADYYSAYGAYAAADTAVDAARKETHNKIINYGISLLEGE